MNIFKKIRIESKMTQTEIAKKLRVCQTYLSKIENGKIVPSVILATFYAKACGVNLGKIGEYYVNRERDYSPVLRKKDRRNKSGTQRAAS